MTERGAGDEGAALDLARLADAHIEPEADWEAIALLFAELKTAAPDARASIVARARAAANGNDMAVRVVERKVAEVGA